MNRPPIIDSDIADTFGPPPPGYKVLFADRDAELATLLSGIYGLPQVEPDTPLIVASNGQHSIIAVACPRFLLFLSLACHGKDDVFVRPWLVPFDIDFVLPPHPEGFAQPTIDAFESFLLRGDVPSAVEIQRRLE